MKLFQIYEEAVLFQTCLKWIGEFHWELNKLRTQDCFSQCIFSSIKIRYTKCRILYLIIKPLGRYFDSRHITGLSTLI